MIQWAKKMSKRNARRLLIQLALKYHQLRSYPVKLGLDMQRYKTSLICNVLQLAINLQEDAPLKIRDNLEIKTKIGRVAAQVMQNKRASALAVKARQSHFATLAMCASNSSPFEIWRVTK